MVDLSLVKPQDLWYIVGLIATDGNLSIDGRHVNITSKDRNHLEGTKKLLGLSLKLTKKTRSNEKVKKYYFLQIGDVKFYKFLLSLGLTPKKSLTLSKIKIPQLYFKDFIRGIIDGDGSISTWVHKSNKNVQWSSRIVSGSMAFIRWLKKEIERDFQIKGKFHIAQKPNTNCLYILKFGKFATKNLLSKCYYEKCFALKRKKALAEKCMQSNDKLSKYGIHMPGWRNWQTRST